VRIVLAVALELLSVFSEKLFEHVRGDARAIHVPHLVDKFSVS
jgi:hypothetical protein